MKRALVLSCGGFKVAMQAYPISLLMGAYKYSAIFGTSGGVLNAVLAAQNHTQLINTWTGITNEQDFISKVPWTAGLLHSLEPLKKKIPQYIGGSFSIPVYASWVAANTLTHHSTELSGLTTEEITNVLLASCTMTPWMVPHQFQLDNTTHWGIDGWFKSAIQIPDGQWNAIDIVSTIPFLDIPKPIINRSIQALLPGGTVRYYCSPVDLGRSLVASKSLQHDRINVGKIAIQRPVKFIRPLA